MAASPSADSYIGSLISLTSKCEIRYEGILYNINTDESSIGLRNVRSFGTEGRKKDGPQIPANDKIYEYILFRGSDIKDLQVKSSPPAQTPSIHNDPAIIQSHYSHPTSTPASLRAPGNGPVTDLSSHSAQLGLSRPTFHGSLPQYPPGTNLGSWGTMPAPATANGSGLAMPMYWPGFYAPSSGLPHLQQSPLLRPQPLQYPGLNISNLPEFPSPLFPPVSSTLNFTSTTLPSTMAPTQTSSTSETTPTTLGANPTLMPPLMSTNGPLIINSRSMPSSASIKPVTIPVPTRSYQTVSQPHAVGSSNSNPVESAISLVTPDQLLQPALSTTSASHPVQTNSKEVEVKLQEERKTSSVRATPKFKEPIKEPLLPKIEEPIKEAPIKEPLIKEPILPLPKPAHHKPNGGVMHSHHYNWGRGRGRGRDRGRGRGRGNVYSRPITKFTEEFDFTSMSDNTDEVCGHLGKSKAMPHDMEGEDEDDNLVFDDAETQKPEIKPNGAVMHSHYYNRGRGRGRGRGNGYSFPITKFTEEFDFTAMNEKFNKDEVWGHLGKSKAPPHDGKGEDEDDDDNLEDDDVESQKPETKTFGDIPRHRPINRGGGRGFRGGARTRGSFFGRGYGYAPRGRGHVVSN